MTRFKFFGFLLPLAIAGGLALMFNFATGSAPAFAAPPPDECKGQNKKNPEC
jgi:hypothetical protein